MGSRTDKERTGVRSMRGCGSGVGWGAVEWVKKSTLRWFGNIERMENEEFVKKVYLSIVEGLNRRGRPLGRWEGRVKEYVSERGVRGNGWSGQGESVWIGRGGAMATPLLDAPGGSEASELYMYCLIDFH